MSLSYLYSKFIKKYIRGKSIKNSQIDKTCIINSGCNIVNTSMDKYSYCGYDCVMDNVEIGSFCSIASYVNIGGAEHPLEWVSTSPVFENAKHSGPKKRFAHHDLPKTKTTIIGHDVWIGHNAIVKQGCTIGNGAVIGAGAVVTKDVKPYSIVGGCPAKHIRYRFSQEIINSLESSNWWNLDDNELAKVAVYINDPTKFIEAVKRLNDK